MKHQSPEEQARKEEKRKRLRRWCFVLAIAFGAYSCLAIPPEKRSDGGYSIGYVIGGAFFGMLLGAIIGGIFNWLESRRQRREDRLRSEESPESP